MRGSRCGVRGVDVRAVCETTTCRQTEVWREISLTWIKPDFARVADTVYVEMKLVKDQGDLGRVIKDIESRIFVYQKLGAHTLFAVHDVSGAIRDEQKFAEPFEQYPATYVVVTRS